MKKAKNGSIYKREKSPYYWVKFYSQGKAIRESTGTDNYTDAQRYLHRRLGEVATGKYVGAEPERVKVNTLFDLVEEDYVNNGRASKRMLESRLKSNLRPFFGSMKATQVGSRQIANYITKRRGEGRENATINRELEILKRAFRLGFEAEPQLVLKPLKLTKLSEDNIREGILPRDQYLTLRGGLPEPYQTLFVCGYHLGTRLGELLKVSWEEVSLEDGEIVIKRYNTKTKEPRILPIYGDMKPFLEMAKERRDRLYPTCPWVFNRKGKPFIFLHNTWNEMMTKLGSPGLHFHDLRRTAVTNMMDAGFSEREAMLISGHKTTSMLRRYHIVKRERIHALGKKMDEYLGTLTGTPTVVGRA